MVHILLSAGHETVADLAEADVILVNTCGFIESAKSEAINSILELAELKKAGGIYKHMADMQLSSEQWKYQ